MNYRSESQNMLKNKRTPTEVISSEREMSGSTYMNLGAVGPRVAEPIYAAPSTVSMYGPMPQDARMMNTLMTNMQGLANDVSNLRQETKQRNLSARRFKPSRYDDTDVY